MSTTQAPIILLLPDWVQQHHTTLYAAKTDDDFNRAFDAFVATNARITLNGKAISRDEYKKTIRGETQSETSATVTFNDVVSVPDPKSDNTVS